ncbi:MAG: nucleotidyl transferase AbiEii/AbiGii toxin family protein [Planctomycetales bacterium]
MSKQQMSSDTGARHRLEQIKELVVIAMFSDDVLLDRLVLKGGNAMNIVHHIGTRASRDIDFSMKGDFAPSELGDIKQRIGKTLKQTMSESNLEMFDFEMLEVPEGLTPDLADFWGGYSVEFKLIERDTSQALGGKLDDMRRQSLEIEPGGGRRFSIDISRHEYVTGKLAVDLAGYRIYVYSPAMIVCEKLRAICQQMREYSIVVKRNRAGSSRARDFLDVHSLVTQRSIDLLATANWQLLEAVFQAKRVSFDLLKRISEYREFHAASFGAVLDTVKPGVKLESFDFYFDFVVELAANCVARHNTGPRQRLEGT